MVSKFFNFFKDKKVECKQEELFVAMLFEEVIEDKPEIMRHFIKQGLREFVKKMYADGFFDFTVHDRMNIGGAKQATVSLSIYMPNYKDRRDRSKKSLPLID